jgi:RNA polymerase sigma factor (sigma-70 family)
VIGVTLVGRLDPVPSASDRLGRRRDERRATAVTTVEGAGDRSTDREWPEAGDLPPDEELVRRIGQRDEDALRRLFRRYAARTNALAMRVLGQQVLAEEAVQDTFLSVWDNASTFDRGRGSVRSWLLGTVHHRAVDLVRREESQRRRAAVAVPDAPAEDPADQVVHDVSSLEEGSEVRAALEVLPFEQRRVIELMYFDGLTQSAIAERLSVPLGTVKSRTLLGMRKLRTSLAGMER